MSERDEAVAWFVEAFRMAFRDDTIKHGKPPGSERKLWLINQTFESGSWKKYMPPPAEPTEAEIEAAIEKLMIVAHRHALDHRLVRGAREDLAALIAARQVGR